MVYREDTVGYEGKIVGSFLHQHCIASGLKEQWFQGLVANLRGFQLNQLSKA